MTVTGQMSGTMMLKGGAHVTGVDDQLKIGCSQLHIQMIQTGTTQPGKALMHQRNLMHLSKKVEPSWMTISAEKSMLNVSA